MMKYVIGIDGGGTKTAVSIVDMTGNVLHSFRSGAINYNSVSAEDLRLSITDIIGQAAQYTGGLDGCAAICAGAAGITNPDAGTALEKAFRGCGYTGALIFRGDFEAALFGALQSGFGIILISGTGSICYGRNRQGVEHQTGGYGHIISDEGSGYSIGRDMLSAVAKSLDGRNEKTILTQMVYDQLGISSIAGIIRFVYGKTTGKQDIAALAPILAEACSRHDSTALRIADNCIAELAGLVIPVAEKLGPEGLVTAVAGSILLKDSYIRNGTIRQLEERYPGMRCVLPEKDAACGAALIALDYLKSGSISGT